MSGLVVIVSPDPAVRALGSAMLGDLAATDGYHSREAGTSSAWAGVRGWAQAVDLLVEGDDAHAAGEDEDSRSGRRSAALVVAFVGDLLNGATLRRDLALSADAKPAVVVRAAYRRWGAALLERLEGAFAFVVHDPAAGTTLASSDPCCVLPLFAARLGDDLLFASEAKVFLRHPRFRPRLDREALGQLALMGHTLGGRPLFADVLGLPHGSHFEADARGLRTLRHWDVLSLPRGRLRGDAYLARLEETARALAAEAYAADEVALPLTGGLDSRLFAALAPAGGSVTAVTFGAPGDHDVALARRIALARGLVHRSSPLERDYVSRHGAETVWALEGRLSPVANITGALMARLLPAPFFVSGAGGAAGRRFGRTIDLVPDWDWLEASDEDFERCWPHRESPPGLGWDAIAALFRDGRALREEAAARRLAALRATRGLPVVDRQDIMQVQEVERLGQTGLAFAERWLRPRAPFLTRRWVEAVLDGAPEERIDDRARVRLVTRIDPRVDAVPWALTRLPLPVSAHVLSVLRGVGRVRRRGRPRTAPGAGPRVDGVGQARARARVRARVRHLVYRHVDERDEWLRGPSRRFVEDVLLSPRVAEHGVVDPVAVRALVDAHLRGEDHAGELGLLMTVELWQRFFEDGERP